MVKAAVNFHHLVQYSSAAASRKAHQYNKTGQNKAYKIVNFFSIRGLRGNQTVKNQSKDQLQNHHDNGIIKPVINRKLRGLTK